MRASKIKCIRLCWLTILVVAVLAVVLAAAPAGVGASGPSNSARQDLRAASLGSMPIVDAVTPKPNLGGNSVLYVDAKYYAQAPTDVTDFVCSVAREGRSVVVLGGDLGDVCERLKVLCETVSYLDDHGVEVAARPTVAAAIKIYPDRMVNGKPFVSQMQVHGDKVTGKSAIGYVQGFLESEAKRTFGTVEAESAFLASAPYYRETAYIQHVEDYGDTGTFNINRSFNILMEDGSSTYDWMDVKYMLQMVPGKVKKGNGWKNDWTQLRTWPYEYPNATPDPKIAIIQYAPTTTVGSTSVSVNVGVSAGTSGAAVTASMGWSYSLPDVQVYDSSDFSALRFELKHEINESAAVGSSTYLHIPGASYRLSAEKLFDTEQYYRAQWANKHWYGWTHITTSWITIHTQFYQYP